MVAFNTAAYTEGLQQTPSKPPHIRVVSPYTTPAQDLERDGIVARGAALIGAHGSAAGRNSRGGDDLDPG